MHFVGFIFVFTFKTELHDQYSLRVKCQKTANLVHMAGVTCVKSVFHAGTGVGGGVGGSLTYNVYDMVLYTNESRLRDARSWFRILERPRYYSLLTVCEAQPGF